ncbi:MAG: hypothetical protein Unbinned7794contig1000_49 [Prokaryotic dsDNA virus sp.]|nr:MAG: hypothetical protein Unbinned7794contig1000_49 [Prokaryotic dsDNA virus sp.]|tara:strand:+ start:3290 stop:3505 length:216 start_codon:yes stop_codon:yes gene_type:complete
MSKTIKKIFHKSTANVFKKDKKKDSNPDLSEGSADSRAMDYTTTSAYEREKKRGARTTSMPTVLEQRGTLG